MIKKIFYILLLFVTRISSVQADFDLEMVKKLPVQEEGRIKPLDTIARNFMLLIHGKQTLIYENRTIHHIKWLLDMTMAPETASKYPLFRVDHPEVLRLIDKSAKNGLYYSFQVIDRHREKLQRIAQIAAGKKEEERDQYQNAVLKLSQQIYLYERLNNTFFLRDASEIDLDIAALKAFLQDPKKSHSNKALIEKLRAALEKETLLANVALFQNLFPITKDSQRWYNMGEGYLLSLNNLLLHPGLEPYATLIKAYRQNDQEAFNNSLRDLHAMIAAEQPEIIPKIRLELFYNKIQPFHIATVFYLAAFAAIVISWIYKPKILYLTAFSLLICGFIIHTSGIVLRMLIEGRPPVTNLYSSALFVGWGSLLLAIIFEKIYRNGFGLAVSSVIGALTLIVAHHLADKGDTMEVMRAVLNSNFWLSTHVVAITLGYSAAFLAGFIGCLYVIRRSVGRKFGAQKREEIGEMAYGVISFVLFFSFLGTVLGGIWADQSWGRFWGWDPKENGALLIILWNAAIIHARHFKLVTTDTFMILTVFGNIITAFSWFGVNMLGVGLHSYGTTERDFFWLTLFMATQLFITTLGLFGKRLFRLFR